MSAERPPKPSREVLREFLDADSPHGWLRLEVARFLYPDLDMDTAFLNAITHVEQASIDLDVLSRNQFEPGELLGFELRFLEAGSVRKALFRTLPSPATLLLLCCDMANVGEEILARHYLAHRDIVEMRAVWPFSMDVAVSIVSPAAHEMAITEHPPQSRPFRRRPR